MERITKSGVNLNVCAYCSCSLDEYSKTLDHLTPKSRGGKLSNDNKLPVCKECNQMKANMTIKEFDRALNGLIFYETETHKKSLGRLKKIKYNVKQIIEKIYGKHNV